LWSGAHLNRPSRCHQLRGFQPRGGILASASKDKTIKLWDVASGRELRTLTGHRGNVESLAPTGDPLVSAGHDGSVRFWNAASGIGRWDRVTPGDPILKERSLS